MQAVRRMKTSPLTAEEKERIQEVTYMGVFTEFLIHHVMHRCLILA